MKYLDEYRDAEAVRRLAAAIRARRPGRGTSWKSAAARRTPSSASGWTKCCRAEITLIHGPGCPVCVTPIELIDKAVAIAARPEVIFCSFGDMLRVPGSRKDLFTVKSEGGDVRVVYSPMDAVALAQKHPDRQVVFFAVGFETTAPANAMAVAQAAQAGAGELFRAGLARAGAAGDAGRARLALEPRAGLSGRRPRLHDHGHGRVPADRREVSRADRGHRLRAGRHPAGRADVRRAA